MRAQIQFVFAGEPVVIRRVDFKDEGEISELINSVKANGYVWVSEDGCHTRGFLPSALERYEVIIHGD